jgi:hypothetical protein
MDLHSFLKTRFTQLSNKNVCNDNEFSSYDNFKKFILDHYQLNHMEKHNYIKFVKVKRQILKIDNEIGYIKILNNIQSYIKIMYDNHTFPNLNIRKYMFKINVIFKLIDEKKQGLLKTLKILRSVYNLENKNDYFKMKILCGINTLMYRYTIFLKYSRKLINSINELINLEYEYNIDHKLIEINNMERTLLGKKSEYTANKVMIEYVNYINSFKNNKRIYYYVSNIDFLKLLNISSSHTDSLKGEVDGILIYYENGIYVIDRIIEVKSSIKATFEDIKKFVYLQSYINKLYLQDEVEIKYGNFVFVKDSFKKIIHKHLTEWIIYLCVNSINQDFIEKSHLYFSNCIKIIDDNFIEDFYIDKIDKTLINKYKIIENNRELIENLFQEWTENIKLDSDNCNIFISKKD